MTTQEKANPCAGKTNWLRIAILILVVEKILQHAFVTLAFFYNWGDIRATVAVNPDILMVLGAIVAVLFGLDLWGLLGNKPWAPLLVAGLALFDILGEFVAQGRIGIQINVSFITAITLLTLALLYRKQLRKELAV